VYAPEYRALASFTTGDAGDLARKLKAFFELSPDERESLAQAARRVAESDWSWTRVAKRLLEPLQIR
jgi:glycosyltransferase involved in cell wall biosynthesis